MASGTGSCWEEGEIAVMIETSGKKHQRSHHLEGQVVLSLLSFLPEELGSNRADVV